jgi:hypothetical protein
MLRAVLLASPLALVLVVSCTSSDSADFKDTGPMDGGSAGTTSSTSGTSAGGTSSQGGTNGRAGSNASAGNNASAGSNASGGGNAAGGKGNTAGSGNTAGNQNTAGKGGGSAGTGNGNAGAPTDMAGAGPGNGGAPAAAGANAGGASGGPLCPDISGSYTIKTTQGFCSALSKNALQSIQGNDVTCQAHFVSQGVSPNSQVGVNGSAVIDENGDFTGAVLSLNKMERSPCSGSWDAGSGRMTIRCGGLADLCTVELDRN